MWYISIGFSVLFLQPIGLEAKFCFDKLIVPILYMCLGASIDLHFLSALLNLCLFLVFLGLTVYGYLLAVNAGVFSLLVQCLNSVELVLILQCVKLMLYPNL